MGSINTKHLFFIICSLIIVTLKTFPSAFIKYGGRDTWIAMIAASVLIAGYVWIILRIHKRSNNYNLIDIYAQSLGKWAGGFFSFFFMLTLLLTLFESAAAEASVMHIAFQLLTPAWIYISVTAIATVYVVKKGIASVTITTVIVILFISSSGMLLAFLTHKYKESKYLFPILEHGITGGILLTAIKILGALSCVSIMIPYLSSLRSKKRLILHSMVALLFVIQMLVFSMIGVIETFGPDRAVNLLFPKLTQTQVISAFGFLEAGELFVMLQVVAGWFIRYIVCFFALMEVIRLAGLKLRYKEYYICALTIIFSYLFSKNLFTMLELYSYLLYIQLANFLIIPLIVYLIYAIRHLQDAGKHKAAVSAGEKPGSGA
ncbi:endospore germination permease [Paenibacillus sp. NFR01]|uniref:GerAB/ArcD/ProY family transporter n=1 Tax=Paenibacillus sp. NFR01 TaxID=1566279 RepID=UPI0008D627C2|nr:endospore germination permease [Paenibacillus sp. NFR01]SES95523.1 spore germination protein (amino acid permease) [Paenibacillus sp. NFR01]